MTRMSRIGNLAKVSVVALALVLHLPSVARCAWKSDSYNRDFSKTFWFIQVSDLHLGSNGAKASWESFFDDVERKHISPKFIVATGDLTHIPHFATTISPNYPG